MTAPSVFNRWSCGFSDLDQVSHHIGTSLFACSANQSVRRVLYMRNNAHNGLIKYKTATEDYPFVLFFGLVYIYSSAFSAFLN